MSAERRYNEDEVAAILERATSSRPSQANLPSSTSTGFTLAELKEIGAEAGIAPEEIAAAALAVSTQASAPPVRTLLGAPRSVSRIVPLTRELADAEWTRLVVALRETFGAEGRIREYGSLRTWRNGNLQVHVEPDSDGYRVRMQTLKGDALPRVLVAVVLTIVSLSLFVENTTDGWNQARTMLATALGLTGIGLFAYVRASLPRWAAARREQMDAIAARITRLITD
jgi:hypothetical protein